MGRAALLLVLVLVAGCTTNGPPAQPSHPAPVSPSAPTAFELACPSCRLTLTVEARPYAHQVAADPVHGERAAAVLLYTPPVDPNNPLPTVPVYLNRAAIAVTEDDGRTWHSSSLPTNPAEGTPAYAAGAWGPDGALWATASLTTTPSVASSGSGSSAGVVGPLAVYRSTDAGVSWQRAATFADGDGYGNVAVVANVTYVSWVSGGMAHVAWSSDGHAWDQAQSAAECFTLGKLQLSDRGLLTSCTYPFGISGLDATVFRLDPAAKTLSRVTSRDCNNGGPALNATGVLVIATPCGSLTFQALAPGGWKDLGRVDLEGMYEISPMVRGPNGTLQVIVDRSFANPDMVSSTHIATHVWLGADGVVRSRDLATASPSVVEAMTPGGYASPSIDMGPKGAWVLISAVDGILASRLVPA